ncbi:GNAT family N-acetyltransferase [Paenibacillus sabinae]|uniref:GCN5-like N-acetyltransferase n=1 Tax=Paenibacillus sabinae T27 TaxID=1268072 RepID=X4ZH35_9BACL|nr:GNAT family protein [Paenibacillus sabinae]AHV98806.1 GCN5-like N-acetyltransferase [Paenibacillus sabinae T27]
MKLEEHFEPFPELATKRATLRPIEYSDLNDIASYCTVPEVSRYTVWDVHKSIEDTKAFIDFVINRYATQKVGPWGIELKESGRIIGSCSFVSWDNNNRRAELGYVLSNQYWNQGIMTEVIRRIIEFGFKDLELIRIEARCLPSNLGSSKVMEKTGMKYEGILRRHIWAKNEFQDLAMYSIIRDDFESGFRDSPDI